MLTETCPANFYEVQKTNNKNNKINHPKESSSSYYPGSIKFEYIFATVFFHFIIKMEIQSTANMLTWKTLCRKPQSQIIYIYIFLLSYFGGYSEV